jgi:glycolate oxidase
MVGLGRMQCYGLAADGVHGLVRMLELLEAEVHTAMGLLGVRCLAELSPSYITKVLPVANSTVLSAFSHLCLQEQSFYR